MNLKFKNGFYRQLGKNHNFGCLITEFVAIKAAYSHIRYSKSRKREKKIVYMVFCLLFVTTKIWRQQILNWNCVFNVCCCQPKEISQNGNNYKPRGGVLPTFLPAMKCRMHWFNYEYVTNGWLAMTLIIKSKSHEMSPMFEQKEMKRKRRCNKSFWTILENCLATKKFLVAKHILKRRWKR